MGRCVGVWLLAVLAWGCGDDAGAEGANVSSGGNPGAVVLTAWQAPPSARTGEPFDVTYTVKNQSGMLQPASVVVALGAGETLQLDDLALDHWFDLFGLEGGEARSLSATVTIPDNIGSGTYTIGAFVATESDEVGHTLTSDIDIEGADCDDDGFEPNDERADAAPIELLELQSHNFCRDVDDWMRFEAREGGHLVFELDGAVPSVELYDGEGTRIESRLPGEVSTQLEDYWAAPADGTYYVHAFALLGLVSAGPDTEYSLVLRDERAEFDFERVTHLDEVRTAGSPLSVEFNLRVRGAQPVDGVDVAVVLSDDDVITTDDREIHTVSLDDSDVDYDSATTRELREVLTWSLPAETPPGSYTLGVIVDPADAWPEYHEDDNAEVLGTLVIEAPACAVDAAEQDDFRADATPIAMYAEVTGNLCDDNSDWFVLELTAGRELRLATIADAAGALVSLYDDSGMRIVSGGPTDPIEWTVDRAGPYFAQVGGQSWDGEGGYNPTGAEYTLMWREAGPDVVIESVQLTSDDFNTFFGGDLEVVLRNDGGDDVTGLTIRAWLSTDGALDGGDLLLGESSSPQISFPWVPRSTTGTLTRSVRMDPDTTPPGDYTVIVEVELTDGGVDRDPSSNTTSLPLTLVEF